jgi:hypothetical protein
MTGLNLIFINMSFTLGTISEIERSCQIVNKKSDERIFARRFSISSSNILARDPHPFDSP